MNFFALRKNLKRANGFSIVGVLVAIGISGIFITTFTSMFITQTKAQKYLVQKFEVVDLKQSFLTAFSNPDVCRCALRPNLIDLSAPENKSFNATVWDDPNTLGDESNRFELSQIKMGCDSLSPPLVIADQRVPGTNSELVVDKIKLTHLTPTDPGLSADLRLDWIGVWEITFKAESTPFSLKPLIIKQKFRLIHDLVGSPENNRKFDLCYSSSDKLGMSGMKVFDTVGSTSWMVPDEIKRISIEAWGGGGGGGGDDGNGGRGGGGGGYVKKNFSVVPGETLTIIVGAGGAGGASGGSCGSNGGASSVSLGGVQILSTNGGNAGCGDSGGVGGSSTMTDAIIRPGSPGQGWILLNGGSGGGGGGLGGYTSIGTDWPAVIPSSANGVVPGGGGGGGHHVVEDPSLKYPGASGARGQVVISW